MSGKKAYCTVGPVPVVVLERAIAQIENQGWQVRFVAFAGIVEPPILNPGSRGGVPSYALVACKELVDGEKMKPPVFNFAEQKSGMPAQAAEEGPKPAA